MCALPRRCLAKVVLCLLHRLSVIPRRLIGGSHEGRNVAPTVPTLDLVNTLLSENAEDSQWENKTPWSFTAACCCGAVAVS